MIENLLVALIVAWAAWRVFVRFAPRRQGKAAACKRCGACGDGAACGPREQPVHWVKQP